MKMTIKLILYFLVALLMTACVGDALVTTRYSVKNKTDRPLTVKSKTSGAYTTINKDTSILISPYSEKTVYMSRFICAFSDCRNNIKNDNFLDSVTYYFTDTPDQHFKLTTGNWVIKKHSAKATINN